MKRNKQGNPRGYEFMVQLLFVIFLMAIFFTSIAIGSPKG